MRTFRGHTGFVESLAFSPVGSLFASGGSDGRGIVWDSLSGNLVYSVEMDGENVGAVAFSPDGAHLATGTYQGKVRVYTLDGGLKPVTTWGGQGRISALAFTPDGKSIAWSSDTRWSHERIGVSLCGPPRYEADIGVLFTLRLSPDGRTVATAGLGPSILLHDIASPANPIELAHSDRQGVRSLAYSPDGRTLAVALSDGVQLWDTTTHRVRDEWKDHEDIVSGVAISPDGSRLLTCSWDQTTRLYEFDLVAGRRGPLVGCYGWKIGRLFDVAISPDSTLAVACGNDGDYLVAWDIE